ncbi:MAG: DEAD/DEAH box helicase, partial [Patescibacteria group bacterium]|nr:DEAD/DEAH box helicase [Patescibacteria group bacterium]
MRMGERLTEHMRLTQSQQAALRKLGIETVRDLLYHLPSRYEEAGGGASIAGLIPGAHVTIVGTLEKLKTKKSWKRRIPVSEGYLSDSTGRIQVRWFSQPYIAKIWQDGTLVRASGKVSGSGDKLYLANPELVRLSPTEAGLFENATPSKTTGSFAIYPESAGVTSLWFRHAIDKVLKSGIASDNEDPLPKEIRARYNLPSLQSALIWIHQPRNKKDADAAHKRFSFEEIFYIQLERQRERFQEQHEKSFIVETPEKSVESFIASFPFKATGAQRRAIAQITKDLQQGHPMSRLLEGDVGSGKTAVAASAAFAVVSTRPERQDFGTLQVAYMAPTEILAKQHFESFIKYFEVMPLNIGLITGSGAYKFPSK